MPEKPATVEAYLQSLPEDRREMLMAVRDAIRKGIDPGFQETIQYGCIGYSVPHSTYPDGYHCDPRQPLPFAGLASTEGHCSLHLFCVYGNDEVQSWFQQAWTATGKKLDMGKACVRFRKLDAVPLDVVTELFRRVTLKKFIAFYESALKRSPSSTTNAASTPAAKKVVKKAAKKSVKKAAPKKAGGAARAARSSKTAKKSR